MHATALAGIGSCAVMAAATAAAYPPDVDLSHHPAAALAPGVGIGIYNGAGQPTDTCTAGWLVHDATGQPGLLTAGHCDDGGGVTYFNKANGFQLVGWFTHRVYKGDAGDDDDIALLGIAKSPDASPQVETDSRIIGIRPVTAFSDDIHLAPGQQLCHYGLISGAQHGGPSCGLVTGVSATKVQSTREWKKATRVVRSITATPTARPPRSGSPSVRRPQAVVPLPN